MVITNIGSSYDYVCTRSYSISYRQVMYISGINDYEIIIFQERTIK